MDKKSRRGLLTKGATVAAAAAGAALLGKSAQAQPKLEKRSPYPPPNPPPANKPMFSRAVAYGNMLFLAGVGWHQPGTIGSHPRRVGRDFQEPDRCRFLAAEVPQSQCFPS